MQNDKTALTFVTEGQNVQGYVQQSLFPRGRATCSASHQMRCVLGWLLSRTHTHDAHHYILRVQLALPAANEHIRRILLLKRHATRIFLGH